MSQSVIFISYRQKDSYELTDRLADDLIAAYGEDAVFQDKESIQGGDDWSTEIELQAKSCSVMLVVIGKEWAKATYDHQTPEKEGRLRLDDSEDWVRKEITLAFENDNIVIPLLVDGAELPNKKWLQGCGLERLSVPQTMLLRSKDYKNDLQTIKTTLEENPVLSVKLTHHSLTKEIEAAKERYMKQLVSVFSEDYLVGISIDEELIEEPIKLREIFTVPDLEGKVTSQSTVSANSTLALQEDRESEQSESLRIPATYLLKNGDTKRVLLQGDAGSGKTFLLSYFLLRLCGHIPDDPAESISHWLVSGKSVDYKTPNDINRLPILIRIRDLVQYPDDIGIVQFLEEFAENELACSALPKSFFEYWLRKKQAFIFVDGLDEAPTAKKIKIVQKIKAFIENYTQSPTSQNRIIITSRSAGNPDRYFSEDDFSRYRLCPFNTRQIQSLSSNWYDKHIADEAEAKHKKKTLQKALSNNKRFKNLARTPLLLTIRLVG